MMLGADLDEDEEAKAAIAIEQEALREYQQLAREEIKETLDFAYYHLGNDGLSAILPHLQHEYLLNVKTLDLSYNSLNDAGLEPLVQDLASFGSPIETLNLAGNSLSDGIVSLIADYVRAGKCRYLANVNVSDCPKITDDGRRKLNLACKRAESNKGNPKLNAMYAQAAARDKAAVTGADDDDDDFE